jgi:hypothetical protein
LISCHAMEEWIVVISMWSAVKQIYLLWCCNELLVLVCHCCIFIAIMHYLLN